MSIQFNYTKTENTTANSVKCKIANVIESEWGKKQLGKIEKEWTGKELRTRDHKIKLKE